MVFYTAPGGCRNLNSIPHFARGFTAVHSFILPEETQEPKLGFGSWVGAYTILRQPRGDILPLIQKPECKSFIMEQETLLGINSILMKIAVRIFAFLLLLHYHGLRLSNFDILFYMIYSTYDPKTTF